MKQTDFNQKNKNMKTGKIILGIISGVAAGAVAGMLFAPKKGTDTRQKIVDKGNAYANDTKNKFNELANKVSSKCNTLKSKATKKSRKMEAEMEGDEKIIY